METKTMKELTAYYNTTVATNNPEGFKQVKRFASKAAAIKRIKALQAVVEEQEPKFEDFTSIEKPVHRCRAIIARLYKINPNVTRAQYIEACIANGVKLGTAARQWKIEITNLRDNDVPQRDLERERAALA